MTDADPTKRNKSGLSFSAKLGLGITAISLIGLAVVFLIVNTMVRNIIYDNVVGISQRNKIIYANEIDAWFGIPAQTVMGLATVLGALPSGEHFADIASSFVADYDFIENVFIGFADGSVINGIGWRPSPETAGSELDGVGWGPWEHWKATERPWFTASREAGEGVVATTTPYLSLTMGTITAAMGTWLPDLLGVGAAVGFSLSLEYVIAKTNEHPVIADGYLMLVGSNGEIIVHQNADYAPCARRPDGFIRNVREIYNGELFAEKIAAGVEIAWFYDRDFGPSYFISSPIRTVDWTLVAIIPAEAMRGPMLQYLTLIMSSLATILIALFLFTMMFVSRLTRSMEEKRESEERLRLIFDNIPMATNIRDMNHTILHCNEESRKLFRLDDKREYIDRFWELSPEFQPDGRRSKDRVAELSMQAFASGNLRFEWMHQQFDGAPIPCEVTLTRVGFKDGDCLLTVVRDLREFHEAQKREREVSERIRLMFDATPLIIQYWDRANNNIDCNRTTLNFYGFSTISEYKRKKPRDIIPELQPDGSPSWEKWEHHLARIFEEGFDSFDFVERKADGGPAFLEIVGYRMKYNDDMVAVTYANDVSELKQSLERMREAEERSQLMLDGTPVSCYLIDKDFSAIDCNKETLSLFEFESKSDGIEKFREVFQKYRFERLKKHFDKALRSGADRFEWIVQKPNEGAYIPCDIAFIRFTHRGEYVVAAYIFDLRMLKEMLWERQRVETAEENSRAKSKFLARMSHEIRTPLSAVLGISEIQLQDPTLPPHTEEALAKINDSAGILLQIVNDILDLSKIEAGKMSLIHEEYEVADLISDVVQLHLVYAGGKKIDFHVRVDENLPARLVGDALRIKQIISNLLSNALKYTEAGSVELSLGRTENGDEGYTTLTAGIRDTGRGMSREQLEALYSEYTRFNEKENRTVGGTGLGMSIVYSLVRMMDAKIDVESETGKGTNVVVRIPQKTAGREILGEEVAHGLRHFETRARSVARRFKSMPEPMPYGSVLVVDDVEANLYVAQGLLMFYGLKIETCDSGNAAIEKVRQGGKYDIIFMDHMMPELNGVETMQILRGIGYESPIVALTANALIGQAEEFLKAGFDGFISKPIQTSQLNAILVKFIRDRQPPEVLEAARATGRRFGHGGMDGYLSRPDVARKLRVDFAKSQKNVFSAIRSALDSGDIETAHRLVHTLKGLAGLIRENQLARAAAGAERMLRDGHAPAAGLMEALKGELARVLGRIEIPDSPRRDGILEGEQARALLDRLHDLVLSDSAESLELLDKIETIPGTEELARQIEECDFAAAAKTLETLRAAFGA